MKNGVVENFKLVTYDLVSAPSDYNASMNGVVEGYRLNEGVIEELTFGLDDSGNIVQMQESECAGECEVLNQSDVETAIRTKFSEIVKELGNR